MVGMAHDCQTDVPMSPAGDHGSSPTRRAHLAQQLQKGYFLVLKDKTTQGRNLMAGWKVSLPTREPNLAQILGKLLGRKQNYGRSYQGQQTELFLSHIRKAKSG